MEEPEEEAGMEEAAKPSDAELAAEIRAIVADVDLEAFSRKDLLQRLGGWQQCLAILLCLPRTVGGSGGRAVCAQRPSSA